MYPNAFLRTFWRLDLRPQVFVPMSFDPRYTARFDQVFSPAIQSIPVEGMCLSPHRVDLSKTGDPILTDMLNAIVTGRVRSGQ